MIIAATIVEFNPMHNGHIYYLEQIHKQLQPDILIVLLSGNITMRGDFSVLSKKQKTELSLKYGVDLVIEFPAYDCIQSADYFARNAIKILSMYPITHFVFGAEHASVEFFDNLLLEEKNNTEFKQSLKNGNSYGKSKILNLKDLGSNDLLGLCYYREIKKQCPHIQIYPIQRIGQSYNDITLNETIFPSASSIRKNQIYNGLVPVEVQEILSEGNFINLFDLFSYIKYSALLLSDAQKESLYLTKEGIQNRIIKAIITSNSYSKMLEKIETKRYSQTYIQRILISILFHIMKEDHNEEICYSRVLGMNEKGQVLLNSIKKNSFVLSYIPSNKKSKELYEKNIHRIQLEEKIDQFCSLLTKKSTEENLFPIILK